MDDLLERSRRSSGPDAQVFAGIMDPREMARIAASYLTRLNSDEIRIVRCGAHIWIRMSNDESKVDLLFAGGVISSAKAS